MRAVLGLSLFLMLLSACAPAVQQAAYSPSAAVTATSQAAARPAPAQDVFASGNARTVDGVASWYGPGFIGRRTANGEVFTARELTAAHRNLPFGTLVRVTNVANGRAVVVRINDRGPFVGNRVIDLSQAAAEQLGMVRSGTARVRLEIAPGRTAESTLLAASLTQGLEGFDVASRLHEPGELVMLTSQLAPHPVLVRVVDMPIENGADLLLSAEAYELLGSTVDIHQPDQSR